MTGEGAGGYTGEAPAEWEGAAATSESYADSCYQFDEPTPGSEEYSKWQEKGFLTVMNQPLSTFAADVDTASYSNLRRMITDGYTLD